MSMLVVVCSAAKSCSILCHSMDCANQASPSFTVSRSLLKFMSVELVMISNHLILGCLLLLLPSIFPSIKVFFQWTSCSHQVAKVLELQLQFFQHKSFQWIIQGWFPLGLTGLILQSKGLSRVFSSTTIQKHQFFGIQPSLWSNSHLYMTIGKTITLTIWTFVGKVMSLLFNTLGRLS